MVLAVVAVAGVTGMVKFEFFAGPVSAEPTPAVRDAMAIAAAADSTDGGDAVQQVRALLQVAGKAEAGHGVTIIRQQLPALAAQFGRAAPLVHERLLSLDLKTATGRSCRVATMRLIALEEWNFRTFTEDVALNRTSAAARRFTRRWLALGRWWAARINSCDTGLPPDERAAVARVMVTL